MSERISSQLAPVAFFLFAFIFMVGANGASSASRVFYDGFETGNTNLWSQVDFRDKCQAVQSSGDGGAAPQSGAWQARCNFNGTVEWNTGPRFETLHMSPTFGNEYFLRLYIRTSPNLTSTGALGDNTGPKLLRYFGGTYAGFLGQEDVNPGTEPVDLAWSHESPGSSYSQYGLGQISRTGWTKYEMYFNKTTDRHRIWIDDVLVRDVTSEDLAQFNGELDIVSNWSGADGTRVHDDTNYMLFDEIEVFSETGSGANGSLSDGTIVQGGGADTTAPAVPTGLAVQ